MSVFLTGGTGYLGGYAIVELLRRSPQKLLVLVRAKSDDDARARLWNGLQLHLSPEEFRAACDRLVFVRGDLHAPDLGLDKAQWKDVVKRTSSVLHIAASLNRKSEKACLNTNLRGTLTVVRLARAVADRDGLKRYTHVSTVAVSGHRSHEVVAEDQAIDWDRSDYDPYGRTKKFAEHLATELLPDQSIAFLRPSTVMGDSRHPRTTQFDMVRAFVELARLPAVPLDPATRIDILNADYVGEAIARVHLAPSLAHRRYHLASGVRSPTAAEIGRAMAEGGFRVRFAPPLGGAFGLAVRGMNRLPRGNPLQGIGAILKVFWPYIQYDTVFDNDRIVEVMGRPPAPFTAYCTALYRWAVDNRFTYPHVALPPEGA